MSTQSAPSEMGLFHADFARHSQVGDGDTFGPKDLETGERVTVTVHYDPDAHPKDYPDVFGTVRERHHTEFDDPAAEGCRLMASTRGRLEWTPPRYATPEEADAAYDRLDTWLRDYWFYVGLTLTYERAPCPHCGERKSTEHSIWGVESDSGAEYLVDLASDLLYCAREEVR